MTSHSKKQRDVLLTGSAAIGVAVTLMAAKTWAYWTTGSTAILSSLLDSGIDVFISAMTWVSLRYSLAPPDEKHRHGHGKIEAITAMIQGALMLSGAGILTYEGIYRLVHPEPLVETTLGAAVMVVSIILSILLVRLQGQTIHHYHSLALEADQGHYASDALMNASTLAVLLLVPVTGWIFLDPLFAVVVAVLMARISIIIGRKAFYMLMDREIETDIRNRILELVRTDHAVKSAHDLRATRSGMRLMISFDMEVDGTLTLSAAHELAVAAEDRILKEFPHAEILIHLDPEGAPADRRHHHHAHG